MKYIKENHKEYYNDYVTIYLKNNKEYWNKLANEINNYCEDNNINYINYFYHEELVRKKKEAKK